MSEPKGLKLNLTSKNSTKIPKIGSNGLKLRIDPQKISNSHNSGVSHIPVSSPNSAHPNSFGNGHGCTDDITITDQTLSDPYHFKPIEILPNIYLGSERNAVSKNILTEFNIGYIVNVAAECPNHWESLSASSSGSSKHSWANSRTKSAISESDSPFNSPIYNPLNLVCDSLKSQDRRLVRSANPGVNSPSHIYEDFEYISLGDKSMLAKSRSVSPSYNSSGTRSFTANEDENSAQYPPVYLKLDWTHNEDDILKDFGKAFAFIEEAVEKGHGVLIHCKQGISRSATLAIGYVMKKKNQEFQQAYDYVKSQSASISPNMIFIYQLMEYQNILMKKG